MGLYSDRERKPQVTSQVTAGGRFARGGDGGYARAARRRSFPSDSREDRERDSHHDLRDGRDMRDSLRDNRGDMRDSLRGNRDDGRDLRQRLGNRLEGRRQRAYDDSHLSNRPGRRNEWSTAGRGRGRREVRNVVNRPDRGQDRNNAGDDEEALPLFFQHDDRTGRAVEAVKRIINGDYEGDEQQEPRQQETRDNTRAQGRRGGQRDDGDRVVRGRGAVTYSAGNEARGNGQPVRREERRFNDLNRTWKHDKFSNNDEDPSDLRSRLNGLQMQE